MFNLNHDFDFLNKGDQFLIVKKEILLQASGLDKRASGINNEKLIPPKLISSLDKMLDSLGVQGAGVMSDNYHQTDPVKEKYGLWHQLCYEFIELCSDKLGDSTHLFIGENCTPGLYDFVVVTDPLRTRDEEEFNVLRGIVSKLKADEGFDPYNNHPYHINRTIQFHQTFNKETILSPDKMLKKVFAIPPAYAAYVNYQRDRIEEGRQRVEGIVASILI